MFHDKNLAGKRRSSPSSCCCKEFVSLVQKAFRDSCNRHLVPYEVKLNPSLPCKRQRSSDSSTSDFASPSPEPEDIEVEFPASSLWDPKTRPFGKHSSESSSWGCLRPEDLCCGYIENSMLCSGCFFALVFLRLERGPDPMVLTPEYYDCELASESNCTLGNDIFNSRYFSSAILTKVYEKTRVNWRIKAEFRLFLVIFVPILKFSLWAGHCGCVLNFF